MRTVPGLTSEYLLGSTLTLSGNYLPRNNSNIFLTTIQNRFHTFPLHLKRKNGLNKRLHQLKVFRRDEKTGQRLTLPDSPVNFMVVNINPSCSQPQDIQHIAPLAALIKMFDKL